MQPTEKHQKTNENFLRKIQNYKRKLRISKEKGNL